MNAMAWWAGGAIFVSFASLGAGAAQDEPKKEAPPAAKSDAPAEDKKVFRNVTPERLEAVLKDLNITYEKSKGKEDGVAFYEYTKNDLKIRVHNYQGKDLWIDAHFPVKATLVDVNNWNIRAKFSRAVLLKGSKDSVSLEWQLDCLGGTTDGIVRQFISRFDGECAQFSKFLPK